MYKRVIDLLFGFVALIFTFPLMALSALMVLVEDGTPIFFRQKRLGKNGNWKGIVLEQYQCKID